MTGRPLAADIAAWRSAVDRVPTLDGPDADRLETHLRNQITELRAVGLTDDEAFLIAVRRVGRPDQPSTGPVDTTTTGRRAELFEMLGLAVAAATTVQVARLAATTPSGDEPGWLVRNASLFVLPYLAAWLARRRGLGLRAVLPAVAAFVVAALSVNLSPFDDGSATELLAAAHLPVALWFVVAHPHTGGRLRSHERRMDFVRFTGEWFVHYVLIALGGGVLTALTAAVLEPAGVDPERLVAWVLPSGAAGAVVVTAWLVEARQRPVEHLAPVLTMLFTPLFASMLVAAAVAYAVSVPTRGFDRELLGVFDALLVVVLGLVLYGISARTRSPQPTWTDRIQLVAVTAALVLDTVVLAAMVARIGDLGLSPNRAAALGLNVVLLVDLAGSATHSVRFLTGRAPIARLERWHTGYLPVLAGWAAAVVLLLPPLFRFA